MSFFIMGLGYHDWGDIQYALRKGTRFCAPTKWHENAFREAAQTK
ncbi:MAG: hypothetical protein AAFP02_13375 [Bacteroidota bacterium]